MNKLINVSCTDCLCEAVKMQKGPFRDRLWCRIGVVEVNKYKRDSC